MTTEQALALAKERHLAGDLVAARELYDRVLAEKPDEPAVLFRVGLLEMQASHLPKPPIGSRGQSPKLPPSSLTTLRLDRRSQDSNALTSRGELPKCADP